MKSEVILVTGDAGFIGFHLSKKLLDQGKTVVGVDCLNDYYDVNLKLDRLKILEKYKNYKHYTIDMANKKQFMETLKEEKIKIICHLAAQAGVRYSIENPEEYVKSNLIGFFNLLEFAKNNSISHFLAASTSSVYGANKEMPFKESQKTEHQLSFYAATKKANEVMAHSYSHINNIPITMFRFFTVYGEWGRPDMALYKFAERILRNEPIEVYNFGKMKRDFTYVADLVEAIFRLINNPPQKDNPVSTNDSLSPVAPFRTVNIGNSRPLDLMKYIEYLEKALNKCALKEFKPMQPGDVSETYADCNLLEDLIGFVPNTSPDDGVNKFVEWFTSYRKRE